MAKTVFELLRDLKLDRNGINQQLNQVRDDINGFNQRIKDQTALQLSLNVGNLKTKLDESVVEIRRQYPTIEGVQSRILRTAIIQKLL